MRILVIIPAYNEKANIGKIIAKIRECFPELDILVIDDGSSDSTADIARNSGARVAVHPYNMGYGVSLQTGYKYATLHKYDFVIQMDGDGQHNPEDIKELLREIEDKSVDVIIGSRFLSSVEYNAPLERKIGMFLFSRLVSFIIRQKVTDSTSGFQALNNRVVEFLTGDFYPFDYPDADVIIVLHRAGFRIKEVPLTMYRKKGSKSMHSGLTPIYYVFKMSLSIFVTLLRKVSEPKKEGDIYAS